MGKIYGDTKLDKNDMDLIRKSPHYRVMSERLENRAKSKAKALSAKKK